MRLAMTTVRRSGHLGWFFASWRLGVLAFSLSATDGAARLLGGLASRAWRFGCPIVLLETPSPNQWVEPMTRSVTPWRVCKALLVMAHPCQARPSTQALSAPPCSIRFFRLGRRTLLTSRNMSEDIFNRIAHGRTDVVFDYVAAGHAATSTDKDGVSLLQWCSYHGDVGAIKFLLTHGESLQSLGRYYGLNTAAFHGHSRLCEYLIEQGADVNEPVPETGETPLHAALCTTNRQAHDAVVRVLLAKSANPNCSTKPSVATDHFMRDCRTKGETPLHRAAAFGTEATIQLLLDAGARLESKDMNGDSPLGWASWYARPRAIIRKLCYGKFHA